MSYWSVCIKCKRVWKLKCITFLLLFCVCIESKSFGCFFYAPVVFNCLLCKTFNYQNTNTWKQPSDLTTPSPLKSNLPDRGDLFAYLFFLIMPFQEISSYVLKEVLMVLEQSNLGTFHVKFSAEADRPSYLFTVITEMSPNQLVPDLFMTKRAHLKDKKMNK